MLQMRLIVNLDDDFWSKFAVGYKKIDVSEELVSVSEIVRAVNKGREIYLRKNSETLGNGGLYRFKKLPFGL